jgi:DNA recombination protein RmuC
MFVPIEGAISAALNSDPELFRYGWDRGVIVVGPANLMMAMQSTAAIWRYEDQNRNAKEIASLAGQLCDKITSSIEDFQLASNKIQDAAKAQNEALKRLGSGRGNVLSLGSRIRDMGVAPKKVAPVVIIDGVTLSGDENDETGAFADRRDVSPIIQLPAQEE